MARRLVMMLGGMSGLIFFCSTLMSMNVTKQTSTRTQLIQVIKAHVHVQKTRDTLYKNSDRAHALGTCLWVGSALLGTVSACFFVGTGIDSVRDPRRIRSLLPFEMCNFGIISMALGLYGSSKRMMRYRDEQALRAAQDPELKNAWQMYRKSFMDLLPLPLESERDKVFFAYLYSDYKKLRKQLYKTPRNNDSFVVPFEPYMQNVFSVRPLSGYMNNVVTKEYSTLKKALALDGSKNV